MQDNDKAVLVFDNFQAFRSEVGRITKKMLNDSELRAIFYIRRNFQRSTSRQIEYIIELSSSDRLMDISQLANGEFATPVAPDFPQIEEKEDETQEILLKPRILG